MRRVLALAVLVLAGCGHLDVQTDVVEIDGERFVCTKTVNRISGNERDGVCYPVEMAP